MGLCLASTSCNFSVQPCPPTSIHHSRPHRAKASTLPQPRPQIRVADDAGEWSVSRRYRNFEVLHRQLRGYAAYRLKLPPKRIFIHSNE